MSRPYTTKSSFTSQTGGPRARRRDLTTDTGRQANVDQHGQLQGEASANDTTVPPSTSTENEKYQRREAYTMIAPNQEKRNKLLQVQQHEEEAARQRKESKRKTPVKMTPSKVGGQCVSHDVVRWQQQQQTDMSKTQKAIEMRQKRERWKQEAKEKEENEIKEKKALARLQAEKNEKKKALQKEKVRSYWAEKFSQRQPPVANEELQQSSNYNYPVGAEYNVGDVEYTQDSDNDGDEEDELLELSRIYPECDLSSLKEVLLAQGSIEGVRQLLG